MSACFPLKSRTDILVVEKSGNQQVHEQKESSPTVTENDEQGSQTFEQAQNFNPKNPIDLNIANIDTAWAGGKETCGKCLPAHARVYV